MNLVELFRKRNKQIVYNQKDINEVRKSYIEKTITAYSPLLKEQIDIEATKIINNPNYKSNYLEELAKVNIFITNKVKCPDEFTREMLIESAFASYQYQKINNLPFAKFEDFFSTDDKKPFNIFNEVVITDGKPLDSDINGKRVKGIMYLNKSMDYEKYTISL